MTDPLGGEPPTPEPAAPATRREGAQARHAEGRHDPAVAFQAQFRAARTEFESQAARARAEFEEANERIKERTGRDLILATLIGLGIGVAVLASLMFLDGVFFVLIALAAAATGTFELGRAFQASGRRVDIWPQIVAGALLVLSGYFLEPWLHWVALFVAVAVVLVWRMIAQMAAQDGRVYADVLRDLLTGTLLQVYVPFLASLSMMLLRQESGEWWALAFLIVVVASDTGAYTAGISFGKHKMAPRISPSKTWEGFAGALVAAVAAGVLLALFMLGLPWWCGVVFGLVILGTATAGDLAESMLKRDLGIKDMSSWIPGHGGVLDRLDSILPSAVGALALYYLLQPLAGS